MPETREFSRRVNVEVFKDEPLTRDEFIATGNVFTTEIYERYLHYFQPYRWHAQAANNKIVSDGESYYNEADAVEAINLLFADDTTMYWARMYGEDRGFHLLRYGKTDHDHQAAQ